MQCGERMPQTAGITSAGHEKKITDGSTGKERSKLAIKAFPVKTSTADRSGATERLHPPSTLTSLRREIVFAAGGKLALPRLVRGNFAEDRRSLQINRTFLLNCSNLF